MRHRETPRIGGAWLQVTGASEAPASFAATGTPMEARSLLNGSAPHVRFEAIVAPARPMRVAGDRALERLQDLLAPGGWLFLDATGLGPGARRRFARLAGRYFDGPPSDGRLPRVVHQRDAAGRRWIVARRTGAGDALGHFEALAHGYRDELPPAVADHYRQRKLDALVRAAGDGRPARVLDLGCGVGLHARGAAEALHTSVVGLDGSPASLAVAARDGSAGTGFAAADARSLPLADGSFDLAYCVNLLHHLKRGDQERCLREVWRVLAPGGALVVFEVSVANPLFRLYMRKVFPRTRRIDRGDEEFLSPSRLSERVPFRLERVDRYTFLPDFVPAWAMGAARSVERALERTPLSRWAIHYTAVLRKPEVEA